MAVTITTTAPTGFTGAGNTGVRNANQVPQGVRADELKKGTKLVNAFIVSTVSTDYAQGGGQLQGIDLQTPAQRSIGMTQIWAVLQPVIRIPASGATPPDISLQFIQWYWDVTRGRLRVIGATGEPNAVIALYTNAPITIDCIILGV